MVILKVNVPGSMSGEQAVTVSPPDVVSQPLAHTTVAMNVRRDSDGGLLFYIGEATKVCPVVTQYSASLHFFVDRFQGSAEEMFLVVIS